MVGDPPPGERARLSLASVPLVLGGLAYLPFGVAEFVRPWGSATSYDASRAYDVVVDRSLYWWSALPGSLGLLLTATGLVALLSPLPAGRRRTVTRVLAGLSVALGAASLLGVVVAFDPVTTGCRILGFLVMGAASAVSARVVTDPVSRRLLVALAVAGLLLVAVWPLVYAVQILPATGAAAVFVLYGAGWAWLGLRSAAGSAGPSDAVEAAGDASSRKP